jgi:hypothetical protein
MGWPVGVDITGLTQQTRQVTLAVTNPTGSATPAATGVPVTVAVFWRSRAAERQAAAT